MQTRRSATGMAIIRGSHLLKHSGTVQRSTGHGSAEADEHALGCGALRTMSLIILRSLVDRVKHIGGFRHDRKGVNWEDTRAGKDALRHGAIPDGSRNNHDESLRIGMHRRKKVRRLDRDRTDNKRDSAAMLTAQRTRAKCKGFQLRHRAHVMSRYKKQSVRPVDRCGQCRSRSQNSTTTVKCSERQMETCSRSRQRQWQPRLEASQPCTHWMVHLPFRKWCTFCLIVRGREESHRTREKRDNVTPPLRQDYTFLGLGGDMLVVLALREEESRKRQRRLPRSQRKNSRKLLSRSSPNSW